MLVRFGQARTITSVVASMKLASALCLSMHLDWCHSKTLFGRREFSPATNTVCSFVYLLDFSISIVIIAREVHSGLNKRLLLKPRRISAKFQMVNEKV